MEKLMSKSIADSEFAARRSAVLDSARKEGLDALLVWSRGGGSVDAYADVYYLTDFHSSFPLVPDMPRWASRGHAALLLPVDGEPIIITDYLDDPENRARVSDVRVVPDITASTGALLRSQGLLDRRIGLVGRQSYLLSAHRRLVEAAAAEVNFTPADHILDRARLIKSPAELDLMRHAAAAGIEWMNTTMRATVAGATEGDAVGAGLGRFAALGGVAQDVAYASGPNAQHYFGSSGMPHWNVTRPLETGDIVHCDQWGPVNGYYTDFARSTVVGGQPSPGQRELLEGAVSIIDHIIAGIRPGITFGDLYARGDAWLGDHGFSVDTAAESEAGSSFSAQYPCFGHSLGLSLDGPSIIEGEGTVITENMVLAIEGFVARSGVGAANHEQNVIVHADRVEVLTAACQDRWWD
jgi:Xaa-Pro dipeptidase